LDFTYAALLTKAGMYEAVIFIKMIIRLLIASEKLTQTAEQGFCVGNTVTTSAANSAQKLSFSRCFLRLFREKPSFYRDKARIIFSGWASDLF
jgi:hypothetical protein